MDWWRVKYAGGIAIRRKPDEAAKPEAKNYDACDVFASHQGDIRTDEGVLVRLIGGGYAFRTKGSLEVLEPADPPKEASGEWAYRITAPQGVRFPEIPTFEPNAPLPSAFAPLVEHGTIVTALRKLFFPDGGYTSVELEGGLGWLFEETDSGDLLVEGVEEIAPGIRETGPLWFSVAHPSGAVILDGPDTEGDDLFEMFLQGKVFEASERWTPPGEDTVYLKLANRPGWVVQRYEGADLCTAEEPPADELLYDAWFRVVYPGGVRLRLRPELLGGFTGQILLCGQFFRAQRRVRGPGEGQVTLILVDRSSIAGGTNNSAENDETSGENHRNRASFSREGLPEGSAGWVPVTSGTTPVVVEVERPKIEKGLFAFQNVVEESLRVRVGPHARAQEMALDLPPFSVAAVTQVVETADGSEGYLELRDSHGWVRFRGNDNVNGNNNNNINGGSSSSREVKMERLGGFPTVDKTARKMLVVAEAGAPARVGPSAAAAATGEVLKVGERVTASITWLVPSLPPTTHHQQQQHQQQHIAAGEGGTSFVLVRGKGWVHTGSADAPVLREVRSGDGGGSGGGGGLNGKRPEN